MRLFELDQGGVRDMLSVLQGLANRSGQSAELPFPAVMNIIKPFALGISTPDGLIALKNAVDPQGDVIADILDNGTVVLNTNTPGKQQDEPVKPKSGTTPTLDKMASNNSKFT